MVMTGFQFHSERLLREKLKILFAGDRPRSVKMRKFLENGLDAPISSKTVS